MRRLAAGLLLALGAAACDSGPKGPGALEARASAEGLGAVLVEVQGNGINGFNGRGSTRAYWSPAPGEVPGSENTFRVLLVHPEGGDIGFDIEVDDRAMEGPVVFVLSAARTDNTVMPTSGVRVSIVR